MKISFFGDCVIKSNPYTIKIDNSIQKLLKECQLNCVNFEAPIKFEGSKKITKSGPHHNQSTLTPKWLEENGFNIVSLANNHAFDYNLEAFLSTVNSFENSKLLGFGSYENAYNISIIDIKGIKLGFLGISHQEFGCINIYNKKVLGVAKLDSPRVFKAIIENKDKVDYLFIISHAGIEYIDVPLPELRELYQTFIDIGAFAVIGSHPHVPQGNEIYKGRHIIYSLGNFIFEKENNSKLNPYWYKSYIAVFEPEKNSLNIIPIIYDPVERIVTKDLTKETKIHLEYLNDLLKNEDLYYKYLDKILISFQKKYFKMLNNGIGKYKFQTNFKNLIKKIIRRKYNKKDYPGLLNLFQCESHRWIFSAILNSIINKKDE